MEAIEPNWQGLVVFGFTWLIACVGFFFVSGSLPVSAAPQTVQSGIGPLLVWLNLACVTMLAVGALVFAVLELRLTSPIVVGGMIFLFAPFAVQDLPGGLKDSKLGLALLLGIHALALAVFYASGAMRRLAEALAKVLA